MSGVLAVMDGEIASAEALAVSDAYQAERLPKLREARAAVAELIEAADEAGMRLLVVMRHGEDLAAHMRLCVALARCGGQS